MVMVAKFRGFTKNYWIVPLKCVSCTVYKSCLNRVVLKIKGSHCVLLCFMSLVHKMLGNPINCDRPRDPWLQMRLAQTQTPDITHPLTRGGGKQARRSQVLDF